VLEEDLKWPNLNTKLSDDKRPKVDDKISRMESPTTKENYEQKKRVSFTDSS
jgi:hypothetical protein